MTYIGTKNFFIEVQLGNFPGMKIIPVSSLQTNVKTSFNDVWSVGVDLVYPTAMESWEVVSSNDNDSATGTGAQTVEVITLDDQFVETTHTISLNGQTPVAVPGGANNFRRNNFKVLTVGAVRGKNLGNLTLQVVGGGAAVRDLIPIGQVKSFDSHITVPKDKHILIIGTARFSGKGDNVILQTLVQSGGTGVFEPVIPTSNYQSASGFSIQAGLIFPEGTNVLQQAKGDNQTNSISIFNSYLIVDSDLVNL